MIIMMIMITISIIIIMDHSQERNNNNNIHSRREKLVFFTFLSPPQRWLLLHRTKITSTKLCIWNSTKPWRCGGWAGAEVRELGKYICCGHLPICQRGCSSVRNRASNWSDLFATAKTPVPNPAHPIEPQIHQFVHHPVSPLPLPPRVAIKQSKDLICG